MSHTSLEAGWQVLKVLVGHERDELGSKQGKVKQSNNMGLQVLCGEGLARSRNLCAA